MPEHVATGCTIDQENRGIAGRCERAPDLKNEDRIGVTLAVERQHTCQLRRGAKAIDAGWERLPTQVLTGQSCIARLASQVIVGCGDIILGLQGDCIIGMDRATGDYMGMIATILNALPIQDALERSGVPTRVLSALELHEVAEPYIRRRAIRHLDKDRIVIFAGGTGSPFFSTDSGAALRAAEISADVVLKATQVDGVYDKDPNKYADAKRYSEISLSEVMAKGLNVVDSTAAALCRDNNIPLIVFSIEDSNNVIRILKGENIGTIVNPQD